MDGEFDFIIVGAGTAGCVLANRLTADPACRVLVVEDGPPDWFPTIHIPAAVGRAMVDPDLSWLYQIDPDASRGGRADVFPCGRTLGGGSSINGLFFSRGQREDFDDWAALGNAGWGFKDVLPYFKRFETSEIGSDADRGRDGPLAVSRLRSVHPLSHVFLDAAAVCGIPRIDDYNGSKQAGASLVQVTQKNGRRHSASRAYLWPALVRRNLKLMPWTRVTRLIFEDRVCRGIEYRRGGVVRRAVARRETILAAGAMASPKLLMLSGIGPLAHLADLGIPVVSDAPTVGANLQEHPDMAVTADVNLKTYNIAAGEPLTIASYLARWMLFGDGPATSPFCQAVAFFSTTGDAGARPDLEILFAPFSFLRGPKGSAPDPQPAVNAIVSLCRPSSRGRVSLRSKDPMDTIRVQLDLLDDRDWPKILAGCRMARHILAAEPFKPYVLAERAPGAAIERDDEWRDYVRNVSFPGNHLVGTCRMAPGADGVVNPDLKVKGIERLRVIDASIMPTLISAHTNAVALMIAEKGADLLVGAHATGR